MKPEEWMPPKEPMTPDEFEKNVMSAAAAYRQLFEIERPPKPSVVHKEPGLSDYELRARVLAIATRGLEEALNALRAHQY